MPFEMDHNGEILDCEKLRSEGWCQCLNHKVYLGENCWKHSLLCRGESEKRMVSKTYRALVSGHIRGPRHFVLDFPISENAKNKKKRSVAHFVGSECEGREGRAAITECVVEAIAHLRCERDGSEYAVSALRLRL